MDRKSILVWVDLSDPAIVFPCDKFPDKPQNNYPGLFDPKRKEDFFRNFVMCELVPLKPKKRKDTT